jgi:hypothetical protein
MKALQTIAAIVVLLALLLAGGASAYFAYFKTPEIPATASADLARPPLAKRALLFVIDGFAADPPVPDGVMPTFARLGREGAQGVARTSSMSLTAPCVYSLGTGRPGTLTLGILDFHAPPVRIESLPSSVVAAGKRVALAGDPSWNRQFGWLTLPGNSPASRSISASASPTKARWIFSSPSCVIRTTGCWSSTSAPSMPSATW